MNDLDSSHSDSTSDSIEKTIPNVFSYNWESVFLGYNPEDVNWEDPRPLTDSPPNPRRPGYYTGPTTSRLIAGAGAEETDMGDAVDPWGNNAPNQLLAPPADRTDQLIQQVALL